jgi:hypothetical protein
MRPDHDGTEEPVDFVEWFVFLAYRSNVNGELTLRDDQPPLPHDDPYCDLGGEG